MDTDKLNKWLTLAANFGVLAGIVFLAVEIRQNTDALYAESRNSVLEAAHREITAQIEFPEIFMSVSKAEPLTTKEHVMLDAALSLSLKSREYSWLQFQNGIIDEAQWGTEVAVIRYIFDSRRNREWWQKLGREYFYSGLVQFVDDELENQPATDTLWQAGTNWTIN